MSQSNPVREESNDEESDHRAGARNSGVDPESVNFSIYDFDELAGGANCVLIRFGMNLYTLRKTRTGRLVLNK